MNKNQNKISNSNDSISVAQEKSLRLSRSTSLLLAASFLSFQLAGVDEAFSQEAKMKAAELSVEKASMEMAAGESSQLPPKQLVEKTIMEAKTYIVENGESKSKDQVQSDLEKIIFPAFDFQEMARRSLGKNWKKSTEAEQEEFVDLFSELISRTYQKRVVRYVSETEFTFDDAKIKGNRASVRSVIAVDGDEVEVAYRLKKNNQGWKVYDMVIANVSLVSNYRSEFSGIVRKERMSGLIAKLRKKNVSPS